jgi:predicted RNase H-like HicB family nuclease
MATRVSFTAVYEPVENSWVQARLAELPGVLTAAPTQEEARALLADALREYLLALGQTEAGAAAPPAAGSTTQAGALEIVIDAA